MWAKMKIAFEKDATSSLRKSLEAKHTKENDAHRRKGCELQWQQELNRQLRPDRPGRVGLLGFSGVGAAV